MKYLNREVLEGLSAEKFQAAQPYPLRTLKVADTGGV